MCATRASRSGHVRRMAGEQSSAQAGINARRTNERGEAKGSERARVGRYRYSLRGGGGCKEKKDRPPDWARARERAKGMRGEARERDVIVILDL